MTKGEREKSNADLEKVTDHVEEADSESLRKSVGAVLNFASKKVSRPLFLWVMLTHNKEIKATNVKIAADDVHFLINELNLDKKEAENLLKQHNGDLLQVVKQLVDPSNN
jgi:hypothetical protein